ncbi:TPA: hypothetical protein HA249_04480 [Candidatus Woesearchaeota archaeon]|nr:MAG: hypothetical protein QT07_C0002G0026 [archaeon GW2011_AR16]HIG96111.1 hypothetical protein [Candidatus Woesearchaeota archaeon]HIH46771.1 hypothetical protein [Candidatus Woesearchaeota archaeon]HII89252.1 hypothetical protein [Candidatus Woesearchaeota archaeon]
MSLDQVVHLGEYLRQHANFGRSDLDWTSAAPRVISPTPFYYQWHRDENGIDIVTQPDLRDPRTARLHSYPLGVLAMRKVDIEREEPIVRGAEDILKWLGIRPR